MENHEQEIYRSRTAVVFCHQMAPFSDDERQSLLSNASSPHSVTPGNSATKEPVGVQFALASLIVALLGEHHLGDGKILSA